MCRLFGFRSVIESQVHRSLLYADNAILQQSNFHSDGWGVAYYVYGSPHLIKSVSTAIKSSLFRKVSGIVASNTVVTHLRKATQGDKCITNSHPFQHGKWIFAHNGNIKNFSEAREKLISMISPVLRRYILGDTDSELLFFLILSHLSRRVPLHHKGCSLEDMRAAVADCLAELQQHIGPFHPDDGGPPTNTYLTFILTDGASMMAFHGGKNLYYSTYKTKCSDAESCAYYSQACENPSSSGFVNHLIFSSEPIVGENIWLQMNPGQIIGVDWNMKLMIFNDMAVG